MKNVFAAFFNREFMPAKAGMGVRLKMAVQQFFNHEFMPVFAGMEGQNEIQKEETSYSAPNSTSGLPRSVSDGRRSLFYGISF